MRSRVTRFGVSAGFTLLLGILFVPLGCGHEVAFTAVPPSHRHSYDSRKLPKDVVEQITACAKQSTAGSLEGEPPVYGVEYDMEATVSGQVDAVTLTRSTLGDHASRRASPGSCGG